MSKIGGADYLVDALVQTGVERIWGVTVLCGSGTAGARGGPVILDVTTATQELAMPPKIEMAQAKGFSLFMLKAIMSGRGGEVQELAKTNLRGTFKA
jgi:hypothetical protein